MKGKALFLDRDGTLIEPGLTWPTPPKILQGVQTLCRDAVRAGFELIVVTNQPDIARGKRTWTQTVSIYRELQGHLEILDFFVCPHNDSDNCDCRKPKPGLFFQARDKWNLDLRRSVMIGNEQRDMEAAERAGIGMAILVDPLSDNSELSLESALKRLKAWA